MLYGMQLFCLPMLLFASHVVYNNSSSTGDGGGGGLISMSDCRFDTFGTGYYPSCGDVVVLT